MNINVSRREAIGGLVVAALVAGFLAIGLSKPLPADAPSAAKADKFSPYVTKDGGISLPLDYREKFLHLGTYSVATKPDKPVDEMHNVYSRPEDIQAYRRDGKFPDGAILVKDVTTVGSEKLTTGQSTWTKDIKIWFVMVKDSKGRFSMNDLWGDGWGWALFEAKDPKERGD
jgi:cytochrome c